jgi:amino acid transporter
MEGGANPARVLASRATSPSPTANLESAYKKERPKAFALWLFFMIEKLRQLVLGKPKDPLDPQVFHHLSLIAFFAWIGLGADGLSSSCYGPEEAFLSLGAHSHLALVLALMVVGTVFLLSASYSQIIELFPSGGGGYLVATKLIGPMPGLISGCALLVDYILTIAISIASAMDAIFSLLPASALEWKFAATIICLLFLIVLNLRGVKESVLVLTPIFLAFVFSHLFFVIHGIVTHGSALPGLLHDTVNETRTGIHSIGFMAMGVILFRAFALGGGTFTGIEAVSNGMQILREPRVATAKKTMFYMAASLSFTAGGFLVNYLLNRVAPVHGQTLNAVLIGQLVAHWPLGKAIFLFTLMSEGALLVVAAQTGFVDGPRVMANMALDHWLPQRFTNLNQRLVMKDGILLMGIAAMAMLFYTHASVDILVVMYSINVFLTFTLSQAGMVRHWIEDRGPGWKRGFLLNATGMLLTFGILIMTAIIKFKEGGWVTIVVTGCFIAACIAIRNHYANTLKSLRGLNKVLGDLPLAPLTTVPEKQPHASTAVLLVSGYNGIGVHAILAIQRFFPNQFKNFVFVSVGVIDSGRFKGAAEVEALRHSVDQDLAKYVSLANGLGFYAESRSALGTDSIQELQLLCAQVQKDWEKKVYFMGQLAFKGESFWTRLLHNQTSFLLQRKLLFNGMQTVILPVRVNLGAD